MSDADILTRPQKSSPLKGRPSPQKGRKKRYPAPRKSAPHSPERIAAIQATHKRLADEKRARIAAGLPSAPLKPLGSGRKPGQRDSKPRQRKTYQHPPGEPQHQRLDLNHDVAKSGRKR